MARWTIKNVRLAGVSACMPKNIVKKAQLNNVRLYATGMNLYTFHDVNYFDPERGIDGMGYGVYPVTKTFAVGVEVTF